MKGVCDQCNRILKFNAIPLYSLLSSCFFLIRIYLTMEI